MKKKLKMTKNFSLTFLFLFMFLCFRLPLAFCSALTDNDAYNLFWPPPPAEPRIVFVRHISGYQDFGIKKSFFHRVIGWFSGEKTWALQRPADVAIDKNQTLYITDAGAGRVHIYEPQKKRLSKISKVDKTTKLVSPVGVSVSEEGLIFIADSYLKKVFAINKKGESSFVLGEESGIHRPSGVFVRNQKLYVVDTESCQVLVFDTQGKPLFRFGERGKGSGSFNFPTYIYVDKTEKIYVTDTLNFRVQIFDASGKFLKSFGSLGDSSGYFSRPKGIAMDSYGHIYVIDSLFDNIQIFDYDKNFLLGFGGAGSDEGEFWLPIGMAIDKNNYIYVADSYNRRISIYHYLGDKNDGMEQSSDENKK